MIQLHFIIKNLCIVKVFPIKFLRLIRFDGVQEPVTTSTKKKRYIFFPKIKNVTIFVILYHSLNHEVLDIV